MIDRVTGVEVIEVVEPYDCMAACDKQFDDVRADESSGTCDEDGHIPQIPRCVFTGPDGLKRF